MEIEPCQCASCRSRRSIKCHACDDDGVVEAADGSLRPCSRCPWVGRAKWNFGSYYLWGDVPALMPITLKAQKFNPDGTNHGQGSWFAIADSKDRGARKNPGFRFDGSGRSFQSESVDRHTKNTGGSWFNIAHNTTSGKGRNPDGRKQPGLSGVRDNGKGDRWFQDGAAREGSKSPARKAASAMIAKIPLSLSRHIAAVYWPKAEAA